MPDLKDLSLQLNKLQKQIPFAMAQALTKVARQIEAAERTALQRHLDNPTPFTVKSVGSQGARKDILNSPAANITFNTGEIPVLGTVSFV